MRMTSAFVLSVCIFVFAGCKKDDPAAPASQYTDRLTLGTGMSGFDITGEATSFVRLGGSVMIYWRLESSDDMAGSAVKIRFDHVTGSTAVPFDSATFTNPQSYGHIMLSACNFTGATGSYRAVGILQASGKAVANKDFAVQ